MSNTIWGITVDPLTWVRLSEKTEAACIDHVTYLLYKVKHGYSILAVHQESFRTRSIHLGYEEHYLHCIELANDHAKTVKPIVSSIHEMTWREVEVTWIGLEVWCAIEKWLKTCLVDKVSVVENFNHQAYDIEGDPHHVGQIKRAMVELGANPGKDIGPKTTAEATQRLQGTTKFSTSI